MYKSEDVGYVAADTQTHIYTHIQQGKGRESGKLRFNDVCRADSCCLEEGVIILHTIPISASPSCFFQVPTLYLASPSLYVMLFKSLLTLLMLRLALSEQASPPCRYIN